MMKKAIGNRQEAKGGAKRKRPRLSLALTSSLLPLAFCLLPLLCFLPLATAQEALKFTIEELPAQQPAWIAGYRLRFPLRIVGDPATQISKSVIARIPAGGWLKPDGSDIAVQNAAGQPIAVSVLSHDPNGDTIIQFLRSAN